MKRSVAKEGKPVCFELVTEPGSQVCLAGTFNNWDPRSTPMKDNPRSGHYKARLLLQPGRYEYKFVVNGAWCADPKCPDFVPNDTGTLNSVIDV